MPANFKRNIIEFHFLKQGFALKDRTSLKKFLLLLFRSNKKKLAKLDYIFCSDRYLLGINRKQLGHDYFTDTISFDYSGPGEPIVGEVYISIDRIRANSRLFKTTKRSELHRVIFHGALHLCGYEDKGPEEKKRMTRKEELLLRRYFETR
jgi:probable rRNA maturation factor